MIALNSKSHRAILSLVLAVVGTVMVVGSMLFSNNDIEQRLLGDAAKDLSWGPSLFRALAAFHGGLLILIALIWVRRDSDGARKETFHVAGTVGGAKTSGGSWAVLILLSAVALGLRLWNLDSDLWHDEIGTMLNFIRPPFGEIITSFPNQNQHLLYSVLAWTSVGIFGESGWAIRLPAVLFGVGSVWALFMLGRRVIGIRQGLLACALMTFSYHHVWFSQNARGYTGLLFFTLIATWLWLEAISEKGSLRTWVAYGLAVVLGLLIHMTMAFVAAAHGLLYVILLARAARTGSEERVSLRLEARAGWKPVVTWLLAGSVTLQMYALSLPEFLRSGLHEVSLPSEWTNPMWVVTETIRNLHFGLSVTVVVLCGGLLVFFGWISILRRDFRAAILMVLPVALVGSIMLVLGHNLWPRFFFFAMGFGLLIVVHGTAAAPRFIFGRIEALRSRVSLTAAGTVLTCLLIAASAITVPRNYALPKQDFTGAREYVEDNRNDGDAVVTVGLAGVDYRYFAPHWSVARTGSELDAVRRGQPSTWLVYTLPIEVKTRLPEIWNTIQKDFQVVKVFPGTLNGGEVYVCRQRSEGVASRQESDVSTLGDKHPR